MITIVQVFLIISVLAMFLYLYYEYRTIGIKAFKQKHAVIALFAASLLIIFTSLLFIRKKREVGTTRSFSPSEEEKNDLDKRNDDLDKKLEGNDSKLEALNKERNTIMDSKKDLDERSSETDKKILDIGIGECENSQPNKKISDKLKDL